MRLEPEVWDALREICLREGIELRELIKTVEKTTSAGGRTSAVRVHVLQYYRAAATRDGHLQAGHGTTTATGPLNMLTEIEIDIDPPALPGGPGFNIDPSQIPTDADGVAGMRKEHA